VYKIRYETDEREMVESMLDIKPLTAEISKRKLLFLHKLLTLSHNTVAKEIFMRKYIQHTTGCETVALGFIPEILNSFNVYVHVYVPEFNKSDSLDHINTGQYIY